MAERDLTGDVSGLEPEGSAFDWEPPPRIDPRESFEKELQRLLNLHSVENECNTPDFILAAYIRTCLDGFNEAVRARDSWYGVEPHPGWQKTGMLAGGGPLPGPENPENL